jgi:S1-C subfamily serine protease
MGVKPINIIPENMLEGTNNSLLMPTLESLEQKGFLSGSLTNGPALIGGIIPGSLADQIKLFSGDIITMIDSTSIDSRSLGHTLK